jgi:tetratricopeptide (TPR) repeat protein
MPRVDTEIPHIAFRHHRIAVHRPGPSGESDHSESDLDARGELTTIQDLSRFSQAERDRMLGLAYYRLHFQRTWLHEQFLLRADRLLESAASEISGDAALVAARAEIAWETGRVPAAGRWADQVLAADNVEAATRDVALNVKVQLLMQRGDLERAIPLLEELTTSRRNPLDWALLGHCHSLTGGLPEAIAAFEQVLRIAPGQGAIHKALVPLYERAGKPGKARKHRFETRRLPPRGFETR